MSYDRSVSDHYTHGGLLDAIRASINKLGKTIDSITIEDLATVDEFHVGGRLATDNLLDQLNFSEPDQILDVGCELAYPVPSATDKSTSRLARPEHYIQALIAAGFKVSTHNNRRQFAPGFIKQLRLKTEAGRGPPPLGLHILMQDGAAAKFKNSADSIVADLIAPVEVIAQK